MNMSESGDIKSLIHLLDDEDREIYRMVREKLIELGMIAVPDLESAWEESFNPLLQQRIEDIVHKIQFSDVARALGEWHSSESRDLLDGWLILSRYQFPDLDEKRILSQLFQIRKDAWIEINDDLTALEKVKVLNHIIYAMHGFGANSANYHAPGNYFLNNLAESKRGNAISLSAIYLVVSRWLNIPVYGVNLPGHFILAYKDEGSMSLLLNLKDEERVLFYLNPLNQGAVFSRREIEVYLKRIRREPEASYFAPCGDDEVLAVMLENLALAYRNEGRIEKAFELEELLGILRS
jgi:regulator of sirC expression with transglutaminase-like and TPR domain